MSPLVRLVALAAVALGCVGPSAAAQAPALSGARVTSQVVLGSVAAPVGFLAGGLVARGVARRLGASEERARRTAYVGAFAGVVLASAAAPAVVAGHGSFPAALGGSAAGLGLATLSVRLGNALYDEGRRRCGPFCWSLGLLAVSLPGIGATVAYNATRD